ncbi:MAG: HAD family hydrolase [Nocardioides sp.]
MPSDTTLHALLLDFDGPLTDLMPYPVNQHAADVARAALNGHTKLPGPLVATTDHLSILRYINDHEPAQLDGVMTACVEAEIDAARTSPPSPHAVDLFNFAAGQELPVAVVSNNDARAVHAFLDRFGWTAHVRHYACRTPQNVARMKPAPDLLNAALTMFNAEPEQTVFVGDAVSDVQAGLTSGIPVIGVAKNETRRHELLDAGAQAVITLGDRAALIAELTLVTDRRVPNRDRP